MDTVIIAIVALLAVIAQDVFHRREVAALSAVAADERRSLIEQVQYASQNMPYYPTLGPFPTEAPAVPEHVYEDAFGYIQMSDEELADAFAEIDRSD